MATTADRLRRLSFSRHVIFSVSHAAPSRPWLLPDWLPPLKALTSTRLVLVSNHIWLGCRPSLNHRLVTSAGSERGRGFREESEPTGHGYAGVRRHPLAERGKRSLRPHL